MTFSHRAYTTLRRIVGPCVAYRISRAMLALKGTR